MTIKAARRLWVSLTESEELPWSVKAKSTRLDSGVKIRKTVKIKTLLQTITVKDLNLLPSLYKSEEGQTNKRTSFQEPWQVGKMHPSKSKTKLCKKCLHAPSALWMSQRPSEIKRPSKLQRSNNPFKTIACQLPETLLTPSMVLNCQCSLLKLRPKSQSLALILESISRPWSFNSCLKQQLFSTRWRVFAVMCQTTCREDCHTKIAKLKKLDFLLRHQLLDMGFLVLVKPATCLNRLLRLQENNNQPLSNSIQGHLFRMQRSAKFNFMRVWMRCSTNANRKQEPSWSKKTKRRSDVWTEQTCAIYIPTILLEKESNQCMFPSYLNKSKTTCLSQSHQ